MSHDLKACLLVAAPSLECPFFNHTVVLLVDHREEGSLGFVVNKPAPIAMDALLDQVGLESDMALPDAEVMLGGPVSPETGWVVFDPTTAEHNGDDVLQIGERLSVSANMETLEHIARGDGPPSYVMMLGYAGWGPGQLDAEIEEGSWIPVDLDPDLVFNTPVDDRWVEALATLGIDPARVTSASVADA